MPDAPFLTAWFEIMDSDRPERILDLITDDFTFSILFSTAAGDGTATDFAGGRPAMEHYLAQREKGVLTHHLVAASTSGPAELFLGEVRRGGLPVASFVAAGQVGPSGKLERLLIGRSPAVLFAVPGSAVPDQAASGSAAPDQAAQGLAVPDQAASGSAVPDEAASGSAASGSVGQESVGPRFAAPESVGTGEE
jgi:hypothetical protein